MVSKFSLDDSAAELLIICKIGDLLREKKLIDDKLPYREITC